MSTTTFDKVAAAARKLTKSERARLVDLLQEPVAIPAEALPGIEAGLADLDAGRVVTEEDFRVFAKRAVDRSRTA